ncbi:hypothetical protein V500_01907 [Pseudogymnoascus sp. VKM F-4518 (FW-2643)]|nr:hypothetical protein V500_01907 [Pseudogymnoascus sp. VKM F-4518 (FW-2643)]
MVYFTSLLAVVSAAIGVSAAVASQDYSIQESRSPLNKRYNEVGTNNGYFYSFWHDDQGTASYQNKAGGGYSLNWGGQGNVVAGKGWNPGKAQTITYSGSFQTSGNGYLAVYGWTKNPLIEYYIVESFGNYDPSSAASSKGSITVDGSSYKILQTTRTNQPSIEGTSTFQQYWSVRSSHRTSGSVDVSAHFKAWAALGMTLGSHDYQIVATEGYHSTGSSDIVVGSGGGSTTPQPTTTTPQPTGGTNPGTGPSGANAAAKVGLDQLAALLDHARNQTIGTLSACKFTRCKRETSTRPWTRLLKW